MRCRTHAGNIARISGKLRGQNTCVALLYGSIFQRLAVKHIMLKRHTLLLSPHADCDMQAQEHTARPYVPLHTSRRSRQPPSERGLQIRGQLPWGDVEQLRCQSQYPLFTVKARGKCPHTIHDRARQLVALRGGGSRRAAGSCSRGGGCGRVKAAAGGCGGWGEAVGGGCTEGGGLLGGGGCWVGLGRVGLQRGSRVGS